MKEKIRSYLWRFLGFDYNMLLKKTDFTLLKYDKFTTIGNRTYDNGAKVWRWTQSKLEIGKYCSIANNVNFILDEGHHTLSQISNYPFSKQKGLDPEIKKKLNLSQKEGIKIGNDVWIGMGSYIMPGVTIGNGVIIAANSVVTKNVKDYDVVGGVPAKLIRTKYDKKTIKKMNEISWWNWDDFTIKNRVLDFHIPIETFIEKYTPEIKKKK